ncbi:hypothetical protein CEP53_015456, partial [Fusarium sp. AF-6]
MLLPEAARQELAMLPSLQEQLWNQDSSLASNAGQRGGDREKKGAGKITETREFTITIGYAS